MAHTNNTIVDVTIHPVQMNAVICPETGKLQDYRHLMKGPDKPKWTEEFGNEIGRLFQGIQEIKVTNTCFFIHKNEAPKGSKVTYSQIVCDIRPKKTETHRVQITMRGNKILYEGPVSTPTADLITDKLHWNRVMSTPDGK